MSLMSPEPKIIKKDAAAASILEVRELEVSFNTASGTLKALDNVSFSIASGRTLGLVGESGCGKSVSALAIMRLVPPAGDIVAGSVFFDGVDLLNINERSMEDVRGQRISMIFQEPMTALNPVMAIGEQIAEPLLIHGNASRSEAMDAAIDMLHMVGIADASLRAKSYPHQLSGGMRQRAMIAMALICNPAVLIADEPTTALDVTIQAQILDLMMDMQRRMGLSMLFITHDLAVVSEVADDVAVMYAGRLVEKSPAAQLFANPRHPYTRALIETIPHAVSGKRLPAIAGSVPDALHLPGGCRFSERCPLADGQCFAAGPSLESLDDGHFVACWKANNV